MIVNAGNFATFVATGALALGFSLAVPQVAAAEPSGTGQLAAGASSAAGLSVSIVRDGLESTFLTRAHTVAEFLEEQNIQLAADDYLSAGKNETLVDGMRIVYRPAVDVPLMLDGVKRTVRTTAATVTDLLQSQNITLGPNDEVTPALDEQPLPDEGVRIVHVSTWTQELHESVAAPVKRRFDINLAAGRTRTLQPGEAGERVVRVRFTQRDKSAPVRTVLASRILREPRVRVIAQGVSEYATLASYAEQGFQSAVHFAGAALHVIATAYTAGCYGCSGVTATGVAAGHGVVAVDPSLIPLGTKLYVPGYGRAVAGDTGGAIHGHRIDLGFNSIGEAMRFGRRQITVYVLR
ncbi:MAG: ubiquitin-like domain-containing protein [Vulcanimicrobiaceae bacterium]